MQVTGRRAKKELVRFACRMPPRVCFEARKAQLELDGLNACLRHSFVEVLHTGAIVHFLRRVKFHFTTVHENRPHMTEIKIGILECQCLARRTVDRITLTGEIAAGQRRRNAAHYGIEKSWTRNDGYRKWCGHCSGTNASSYSMRGPSPRRIIISWIRPVQD